MSEPLKIKLNRLAKEYMERFGRHVPMIFGATEERTVEALEKALEKNRPVPEDYNWYPNLPPDADV